MQRDQAFLKNLSGNHEITAYEPRRIHVPNAPGEPDGTERAQKSHDKAFKDLQKSLDRLFKSPPFRTGRQHVSVSPYSEDHRRLTVTVYAEPHPKRVTFSSTGSVSTPAPKNAKAQTWHNGFVDVINWIKDQLRQDIKRSQEQLDILVNCTTD